MSSALAVGKERMGHDAIALVQLLCNIQRKLVVNKLLLPSRLTLFRKRYGSR